MEVFTIAQTFNRLNFLFLGLHGQDGTGVNIHVVHEHGAGTAATVIARPLRAGEIQSVSENVVQGPIRRDA